MLVFQVLAQQKKPKIKAPDSNFPGMIYKEKRLTLSEYDNCFFAYFPSEGFEVIHPKKRMSVYDYSREDPNASLVTGGGYFHKSGKDTGLAVSNGAVRSKFSFDKKNGRNLSYWYCTLIMAFSQDGKVSLFMLDSRNIKPFRKYVKYEKETYLYLDSGIADAPKNYSRRLKTDGKNDQYYLVIEAIEAGKALIYNGEIIKRRFYPGESNKRRRSGIGIVKNADGEQMIVSIVSKKFMSLSDFASFAKNHVQKDGYELVDFMSLDGGGSVQMVCGDVMHVISSDVPKRTRDKIESGDIDSLDAQDIRNFENKNRKLPSLIIYRSP